MAKRTIDDLPPHDRRRFFRAGLLKLVGPLAAAVEKRLPAEFTTIRTSLRPPGALSEKAFLDTCFRSGACADACPANAIVLSVSDDARTNGTPYVEPNTQACVVCDELACMKVCPSGALRLVGRLEIRMGLARVDYETCVRTKGEDCTECVDQCPLGSVALRLDERGRVEVIDPAGTGEGCTGCGVCQQVCPTKPKAIRIEPY